MPTRVVSDRQLALKVAQKYAPRIFQEYGSVFDLIAPISREEIEEVIRNFAAISSKPTLSFSVRDDRNYWYIYYLVYHAFDVSFSSLKLMRKLDSHRHDTEGILLRIPKLSGSLNPGGHMDMITVAHERFKYARKTDRRVVIERDGHGIRPYSERGPGGNFVVYKVFDFFDLNSMTDKEWETMRKDLAGVSMPDEQKDAVLSNGSRARRVNMAGDIYLRPDRLFKAVKMKGWL